MKSYCWGKEGKEETEKYEFVKKYAEWMGKPQGVCPYKDPDEVSGLNYEFYGEITKFLKKQQERYSICFDYEWKFEEPESEKKYPEDRTIALKKSEDDDEAYLYLTSDQFGFSAITKEDRTWSPLKYPYAIYERCYKGDKSLIGDTIWYTRTIGGSFLWPKVKCRRNWQSSYNLNRGVSSYIEDRVDLTLYEIKEFYDEYVYKKEASDLKDKLKNKGSILLRDSDAEAIYNWLSIFKDFKTYVDFFCFNDFVNEEYYPKDIFTGKSITKDNISEYREKGKSKYKFIQNKATKNDLEKAFINLIIWTKDRSKNME
ncbi:MAG: hypothetical protein KBG05_04160 [Lachnospiraceae bacterium]|nr:hypothetical protein [Lachnospiraceae bacterium]